MELQEKLGYVAMLFLAILAVPYTVFGYTTGLADSLADIMKIVVLVWLILYGLALLLFALDGLVGGMVPDSLAPLVTWIVILLEAILIIVIQILNYLEL